MTLDNLSDRLTSEAEFLTNLVKSQALAAQLQDPVITSLPLSGPLTHARQITFTH